MNILSVFELYTMKCILKLNFKQKTTNKEQQTYLIFRILIDKNLNTNFLWKPLFLLFLAGC
jgi:hypothetical protein